MKKLMILSLAVLVSACKGSDNNTPNYAGNYNLVGTPTTQCLSASPYGAPVVTTTTPGGLTTTSVPGGSCTGYSSYGPFGFNPYVPGYGYGGFQGGCGYGAYPVVGFNGAYSLGCFSGYVPGNAAVFAYSNGGFSAVGGYGAIGGWSNSYVLTSCVIGSYYPGCACMATTPGSPIGICTR